MPSNRIGRINEEIQRELAALIQRFCRRSQSYGVCYYYQSFYRP